ncbi:MAG: hypothetical protein ACOCXD_01065 [Bacteroidota bacterium]
MHNDLEFANYLIRTEQYDDAIFLLDYINTDESNITDDDHAYLKGWAYYNKGVLDSSASYLASVKPEHVHFTKSRFFYAYNMIYLGNTTIGKQVLLDLEPKNTVEAGLVKLELSGISLLERDFNAFDKHSARFSGNHYIYAKEEQLMKEYALDLKQFNPKKMWIAGVMSAIIPGSGKFYTGKHGEGLSAFLAVVLLSGITYENYKKAGATNWKTLTFGSLTTIFYVGNIYGSVFSVKLYRDEFYKTYDNKILFHLQIPLRTAFH